MAEDITVLIIDAGARGHALCEAYLKSPNVNKVIVAPGNDFIAYGKEDRVTIDKNCSLKDPRTILKIAQKYEPDIIDVAQDDALAAGAVDLLTKNRYPTFGPTKAASQIEWNKKESRKFMSRHKIPTPWFRHFTSEYIAKEYVKYLYNQDSHQLIYIKAAGLCGGKGALDAADLNTALDRIEQMKKFGDAGKTFVIEEGLKGEEFSSYAISDGTTYHIFKSAQDNKKLYPLGPQTGGVGAISPAMVTESIEKDIEEQQISRAIQGMQKEGNLYTGILYLGGILTDRGINTIEFNARWGDPEVQTVLPGLKTDYTEIILACLEGRLKDIDIKEDNKTRVCVVGSSRGYPGDYSDVKGKEIYGLEDAMEHKGVTVFGAGIKVEGNRFYADGGRLFSIVGEGRDIIEAKKNAYSAIAGINIEGNNLHYRTDIGWRDVERFLNI